MIPYGTQDIHEEDISSVIDTLRSPYLTQGPKIKQFEDAIAGYGGSRHAIACNSATSALHLACLALGLQTGDRLWTSPNSFVASANCGLYCGALVDFIDIELNHFNISPLALEEKLIWARENNQLPKILVAVHFAGEPCNMSKIHKLSKEYGFKVIEDASHAIGSTYKESKTGSCTYSDITIFSFHPVKIITSGEGGCALTNDPILADKMRLLQSHGITRDSEKITAPSEPWFYEQQDLGFNYRMTDIHASIGLSQLKRVDDYIKRRHFLADHYDEQLKSLPLILPKRTQETHSSLHLYPIQICNEQPTALRKELFIKLQEDGIGVNVHYIPIHYQPYYQAMGFSKGDYPNAEKYYSRTITIPLHPKLSENDVSFICDRLKHHLG